MDVLRKLALQIKSVGKEDESYRRVLMLLGEKLLTQSKSD